MLYLCTQPNNKRMNNTLQQQPEKKLKVKYSNFQTTMSFNEWAQTYNVGSQYKEEPKLYQGNAIVRDVDEGPIVKFIKLFLH